jgi:hypothetical protein
MMNRQQQRLYRTEIWAGRRLLRVDVIAARGRRAAESKAMAEYNRSHRSTHILMAEAQDMGPIQPQREESQ